MQRRHGSSGQVTGCTRSSQYIRRLHRRAQAPQRATHLAARPPAPESSPNVRLERPVAFSSRPPLGGLRYGEERSPTRTLQAPCGPTGRFAVRSRNPGLPRPPACPVGPPPLPHLSDAALPAMEGPDRGWPEAVRPRSCFDRLPGRRRAQPRPLRHFFRPRAERSRSPALHQQDRVTTVLSRSLLPLQSTAATMSAAALLLLALLAVLVLGEGLRELARLARAGVYHAAGSSCLPPLTPPPPPPTSCRSRAQAPGGRPARQRGAAGGPLRRRQDNAVPSAGGGQHPPGHRGLDAGQRSVRPARLGEGGLEVLWLLACALHVRWLLPQRRHLIASVPRAAPLHLLIRACRASRVF